MTLVLLLTLVVGLVPAALGQTASADEDPALVDVTGGVHKPAIDNLHRMGLFEGTLCGEQQFCGDQPILRWVVAVWLVRALDAEDLRPAVAGLFEDVDHDGWWAPYVEILAEVGVTRGCATDPPRFCPDQSVTRGQMASFLVRAFHLPATTNRLFVDTDGSVHQNSISALASAGITKGCLAEPARYCPDKVVTRAQMATFLDRVLTPSPPPTIDPPEGATTPTSSPPVTEPPEETTSDGYSEADILAAEAQMAELVNGLRADVGQPPLTYDSRVAAVARRWSETMATTGDILHNPAYADQYPPGWQIAGENVAWVSTARLSLSEKVQWAFDGLVDSPRHHANMVRESFTHIGVGVAVEGYKLYVTQNFARYPAGLP